MMRDGINVGAARVLVMGLTFKENCPDLRNTRLWTSISSKSYRITASTVDVYDPHADPRAAEAASMGSH